MWYFYHATAGLQLPTSYCFVLDYPFINLILSSLPPPVLMSVLCLAITPIRIPSVVDHLCPATLTAMLPSIQPPATTLLAITILLRHFHCPHSSLYKLCFAATGFLLDSWTVRMGPMGCPGISIRNYHYSLCSNPNERSSQLSYAWH